jgi:hypothetical protein
LELRDGSELPDCRWASTEPISKMGLKVESTKTEDGERVYSLAK